MRLYNRECANDTMNEVTLYLGRYLQQCPGGNVSDNVLGKETVTLYCRKSK